MSSLIVSLRLSSSFIEYAKSQQNTLIFLMLSSVGFGMIYTNYKFIMYNLVHPHFDWKKKTHSLQWNKKVFPMEMENLSKINGKTILILSQSHVLYRLLYQGSPIVQSFNSCNFGRSFYLRAM